MKYLCIFRKYNTRCAPAQLYYNECSKTSNKLHRSHTRLVSYADTRGDHIRCSCFNHYTQIPTSHCQQPVHIKHSTNTTYRICVRHSLARASGGSHTRTHNTLPTCDTYAIDVTNKHAQQRYASNVTHTHV